MTDDKKLFSDTPVWDSLDKPNALTLTDEEYALLHAERPKAKRAPRPRRPSVIQPENKES